jgi:hypothetical protein
MAVIQSPPNNYWDKPTNKTLKVAGIKSDLFELSEINISLGNDFVIVQTLYRVYMEQFIEKEKAIIYGWQGFTSLELRNNKYNPVPQYIAKKWDGADCSNGELHQIFICPLAEGDEIVLVAQPNTFNRDIIDLHIPTISRLPTIVLEDLFLRLTI